MYPSLSHKVALNPIKAVKLVFSIQAIGFRKLGLIHWIHSMWNPVGSTQCGILLYAWVDAYVYQIKMSSFTNWPCKIDNFIITGRLKSRPASHLWHFWCSFSLHIIVPEKKSFYHFLSIYKNSKKKLEILKLGENHNLCHPGILLCLFGGSYNMCFQNISLS